MYRYVKIYIKRKQSLCSKALPSINRCSLTREELSSGGHLGPGIQRGKPERPPPVQFARCVLRVPGVAAAVSQKPQWEGEGASGLFKRPPSGRMSWQLNRGEAGLRAWRVPEGARERLRIPVKRSKYSRTFLSTSLKHHGKPEWYCGHELRLLCYCPSPPESRGGKEFKEFSKLRTPRITAGSTITFWSWNCLCWSSPHPAFF